MLLITSTTDDLPCMTYKKNIPLKMIPTSHRSAKWCIMVNGSMWCLIVSIKGGMLDLTVGVVKKVIYFNRENHSFSNILLTQIIQLHIYQVFQ